MGWSTRPATLTPCVLGSVASTNDIEASSPVASPCSTSAADSSASDTEGTPSDRFKAATGVSPRRNRSLDQLSRVHNGVGCRPPKCSPAQDRDAASCAQISRPPRPANPRQRKILGTLRSLLSPGWAASTSTESDIHRKLARKRTPSRRFIFLAIEPAPDPEVGVPQTCYNKIENFHYALDNPLVEQHLQAFCRRTLSSENVAFVRQVR